MKIEHDVQELLEKMNNIKKEVLHITNLRNQMLVYYAYYEKEAAKLLK